MFNGLKIVKLTNCFLEYIAFEFIVDAELAGPRG